MFGQREFQVICIGTMLFFILPVFRIQPVFEIIPANGAVDIQLTQKEAAKRANKLVMELIKLDKVTVDTCKQ